jgi:hypothetical protein
MAAGWQASMGALVAGAANLWVQAPGAGAPPSSSASSSSSLVLAASFALETVDARGTDKVAGSVRFLPGGDVCVVVTTPRPQEMRLSARELVIYYPDRDLALVANVSPRQAPPMLDAIAAGVVDPGSTLPSPSKLVERRHADGKLFTRWQVVDASAQELGEMRAVESREGTISLEIADRSGRLQRRFGFADRVRVAGRSVPRAVVAEYFAAGGERSRREQWSLADVTRLDPAAAAATGCARIGPHTTVQNLPW